jgi:predicted helicase
LSEYDPQIREKRGVYYTPEPVVSFIVRSVHGILREHFGKPDGLADIHIKILDPAAGTLTFITEAAKLALKEYLGKYGEGVKEGFIRSHLLQNLYAFELMMAPYAVGHLKMSYILEEMKFRLPKKERFKLYLTNTLEMQDIEQAQLPGISTLSKESRLAGKVKKQTPILVILGNPPYSGHSSNIGEWISREIKEYYRVDGKPLGEKNPKWLQDDYVKFIRFAQWKIDQNGEGVLGFITNHSYMDNPTFRGMRQSLMKSFDEIYLLDLHGNSLKKERCPDGSKDENIFDIRQGVAIALMIKKKPGEGGSDCNVFHSEIWGLRGYKYDWLSKYEIDSVDWKQINPTSPYYFFIPREEKNREIYEQYWKVTDIFPVNVSGIVTARDHFVIDFDEGSLKRRIEMFNNISIPDEIIRDSFKLKDTRGWKLGKARKELSEDDNWGKYIARILYRPFDIRSILYSQKMVDWPRLEFMSNMFYENLGLITNRQVNGDFRHALCTNMIINDCTVSLETRERSYLFPLYLYADRGKKDLFSEVEEGQGRRANIEEKFFRFLEAGLVDQGRGAVKVTPEEIFYYIYAVLYANIYRQKYAEFLRIDFPRVPFTADYRLFVELAKLGRALADIHLMKSPDLDDTFARFEKAGTNQVKKVKYDDDGRVFINNDQYFFPIPPEIWQYQIGGYQVMHKWLKDRKGRSLSLEDIRHYIRISRALQLTIRCQEKIDHLYPQVEDNLLNPQAPTT